jgi:hypothetical protein
MYYLREQCIRVKADSVGSGLGSIIDFYERQWAQWFYKLKELSGLPSEYLISTNTLHEKAL